MKFRKLTDKEFNTLVKYFCIFAIAYFAGGVAMAAPHPIKIAVIDTGFDFKSEWKNLDLPKPKLCTEGHKSFAGDLTDNHGHGTHIAGLIAKDNDKIDYCLIIIKFYDPNIRGKNALGNAIEAYQYLLTLDVDIVNFSGGGTEYSKLECDLINQMLNKGMRFVAAAGNERSDLSKHKYYPAMCNVSIYKIAATTVSKSRLPASNFTTTPIPNMFNELGDNVYSLMPNNSAGRMTGTSQATAIFTSKLAYRLYMDRYMYDMERYKVLRHTA